MDIEQSGRGAEIHIVYDDSENHIPARPHRHLEGGGVYFIVVVDWGVDDLFSGSAEGEASEEGGEEGDNDEGDNSSEGGAVVGLAVVAEEGGVGEEVGVVEEAVEVGPTGWHFIKSKLV